MNAKQIIEELRRELTSHHNGCVRNEAAGVYMPRHEFQTMVNLLSSLVVELEAPKKADQLSEVEVWKAYAENWKEAAMAWKELATVAKPETVQTSGIDSEPPTVHSIIQYGEDILDSLRGNDKINPDAWWAIMAAVDKMREKPLSVNALERKRVDINRCPVGVTNGTELIHYRNSLDIFKNELLRQGFYPVIVDNKP